MMIWNFFSYSFFPALCGHPNAQQTVDIRASSISYFIHPGKKNSWISKGY